MNDTSRRVLSVIALAVAPVLLALGVAATSRADAVVSNPGPQIYAGQSHAGGVNGTAVMPGTPEHHHHQKSR
jgi:hypothetical protein